MENSELTTRSWSGRRLPEAAGLFELGGDGEEEFFFVRAGDELDADGKALGRAAHGERKAGETREIEPLAEAHGVAIVVRLAGGVVSGTMRERGFGGDRGEKDRNIAELTKNRGADLIAIGAGFLERFESDGIRGNRRLEIVAKHGAELGFLALGVAAEQVGDDRTEEKPPEFERLFQIVEFQRFDSEVQLTQKLSGAAQRGESFRRGTAKFRIFQDANAETVECRLHDGAGGNW